MCWIKKNVKNQSKGVKYYMFRGSCKIWKEKEFEVYAY